MCAPNPYFPGRRYLVAPDQHDGKLSEGVCFTGRDVEFATEEAGKVREYFAGRMSLNVYGSVVATGRPEMANFLLLKGEAKRLAGVTVSTSHQGRIYSTISRSDGGYTLPLPGAGVYRLTAALSPYQTASFDLPVPGQGCMPYDFGLKIDNTISGRVFDHKGQPLKNPKVGLMDLDNKMWLDDAYTQDPTLSFTFKNVPIGRYLLAFNPKGPQSDAILGVPLERTYYPLGTTRTSAKTVEVKSAGIHLKGMDLKAGKPVALRKVTVRVRFPDGAPMRTAVIRCTGSPIEDGDEPWLIEKVSLNAGSVEFSVPANRKLRIELSDWYRRDLKAAYISTHEPGSTSIVREFIVKP